MGENCIARAIPDQLFVAGRLRAPHLSEPAQMFEAGPGLGRDLRPVRHQAVQMQRLGAGAQSVEVSHRNGDGADGDADQPSESRSLHGTQRDADETFLKRPGRNSSRPP